MKHHWRWSYAAPSEQQVNYLNLSSKLNQSSLQRFLINTRDDPNLVLSLLVQLKEHGVSPNVNAYATLVRILSNWGLDRKLDSVLVELIENEERGFSVMDLIEVIGEDGEEDNQSLVLIRVSGALSKRLDCVPDIKACNFLLNRLIEFGKTDMVVSLFRQLKQLGLCDIGN
ncbi:putative tetratricopeptide-like helical domain superfamily [Arabidopsis thaliana]